MPKSSAPNAQIVVTSVRIERAKLDRLKQVADANRRSVSQHMRFLIDQAIDEYEREAA